MAPLQAESCARGAATAAERCAQRTVGEDRQLQRVDHRVGLVVELVVPLGLHGRARTVSVA
eukprot:5210589-Pleurochrysis_carterae.AAC.1